MPGADPIRRESLVRGLRVGVEEDHRDRLDTQPDQDVGLAVDLIEIQGHEDAAVRGEPLVHLASPAAGHQGTRAASSASRRCRAGLRVRARARPGSLAW